MALRKGLASAVIVVVLGAQTVAVVWPSGARWYPFLSYPMYSRSAPPGETRRVYELWMHSCERPRVTRKVEPPALGYQDDHFRGELTAIARDGADAGRYREMLGERARRRLSPRPCALQVQERTIPTDRGGVRLSVLRDPLRVPRVEWTLRDAGAARTLTPP